jgi:hypothetical protein
MEAAKIAASPMSVPFFNMPLLNCRDEEDNKGD